MLTEHTWELALSVGFHAAVVCVAYLHCDHPCEHLARVCAQMCRCCGRTGNSSSSPVAAAAVAALIIMMLAAGNVHAGVQ